MSFSFEIRDLGDEFGMNLAAVGVWEVGGDVCDCGWGFWMSKSFRRLKKEFFGMYSFDVHAEQ
jgi:hypothetical protein